MKRKELIDFATFWTSIFLTALIYILGKLLIPYFEIFEMITSIWGIFAIVAFLSCLLYEHIL